MLLFFLVLFFYGITGDKGASTSYQYLTSFFSISPRNVVASSEVRRQLSTIPDRLRFKQLPTVYAGENVFSRERSDIIIAVAYAQ